MEAEGLQSVVLSLRTDEKKFIIYLWAVMDFLSSSKNNGTLF
jgi:hypothetical protein